MEADGWAIEPLSNGSARAANCVLAFHHISTIVSHKQCWQVIYYKVIRYSN